jgi:hypothetical protein
MFIGFDWTRVDHIFREAAGHVNAVTMEQKIAWVNRFLPIVNNKDNFVGYKMNTVTGEYYYPAIRIYEATVHGMRLYCEVHNGQITQAGYRLGSGGR